MSHGHIYVNDRKITIPSFQCKPNDRIEVKNNETSKKLVVNLLEQSLQNPVPNFLTFDTTTLKGKVTRVIENNEVNLDINQFLIVEYYSRK